jgi:hypothetical protein
MTPPPLPPREPAAAPLQFDHQAALLCPFCNFEYVHINTVNIGARGEDGPPYRISVDAVAGAEREDPEFGEALSSRRHWVELIVECENCASGSIVFAQHTGQTLVSTRSARLPSPPSWAQRTLGLPAAPGVIVLAPSPDGPPGGGWCRPGSSRSSAST